jgi:hypothetical protein
MKGNIHMSETGSRVVPGLMLFVLLVVAQVYVNYHLLIGTSGARLPIC